MEGRIRRLIAYAAAARIHGQSANLIYSKELRSYYSMFEGTDLTDQASFHGIGSGALFHDGIGCRIDLFVRGKVFSGHEFHSDADFEDTVVGHDVKLYDMGRRSLCRYVV